MNTTSSFDVDDISNRDNNISMDGCSDHDCDNNYINDDNSGNSDIGNND